MGEETAFRTVGQLYQAKARPLQLRLTGGVNGLENRITSPRIQKLGLALSGYVDYLHPGRVQFVGRSETHFLTTLGEGERLQALRRPFDLSLCCIVVTGGLEPPVELVSCAREYAVPILLTPVSSSRAVDEVTEFLEEKLAPATTIHAVFMEVFGMGVLILGNSGVGKSECGLELVMRGHRLVSDDLVEVRRQGSDRLVGGGPDHLRFHMEVRGLGIISIKDLFGISSVSTRKEVDLAIELVHWRENRDADRITFEDRRYELLETSVPLLTMPVASGRNVASLVEVAVRLHLLRKQGYHPSAAFFDELERKLGGSRDEEVD
jgi:HPr kinase/phosphorylase